MESEIESLSSLIYDIPSFEVLEQFALEVCYGLGDPSKCPEIALGLAGFLTALARAQAKMLNRQSNGQNNHVSR